MRITLKTLEKAKACSEERKRFARIFPSGCTLNEANVRKWAKGQHRTTLEGTFDWVAVGLLGCRSRPFCDGSLYRYWDDTREQFIARSIKFFAEKLTAIAKRKRRKAS